MLQNLKRDEEAIKTEVRSRILDAMRNEAGEGLLEVINATLYLERERLRKHAHLYKDPQEDRKFYRKISRRLSNTSEAHLTRLLDELVAHYLDEIMGNFDPRMYRLATAAIPRGLTLLMNTLSPLRLLKNFPDFPSVEETIVCSGEMEWLRRLEEAGHVLVYTPEHQSNLDSPALGFAIHRAGLPPVMYGAGLNLFQMPLFPFFMERLGAYTVDRLKTAPLYKRVLKEFAAVTLEFGYDHLFFPGGTRIRSGGIERRLKKGLLGTVLEAFVSSRMARKSRRYYVVPVTMTYHLVLEAATLIADHLQEAGKSRFIIIDDESSKPAVILDFVNRLLAMEGRVFIHFCEPLDPFGNRVDEAGESIDRHGRRIDIEGYIRRRGKIVRDAQRDAVYTRQLEGRIVSAYLDNTTILSTHLAAHLCFRLLRDQAAETDLFKFLRETAFQSSLPLDPFLAAMARMLGELRAMRERGKIRLEPLLERGDPLAILMNALKYFGVYHEAPVIERKGNRLFTRDPNLLYYYHNKLEPYRLEVTA